MTQGCGQGNLRGAVGEAAFMIGMERNPDVVAMASYAPLFVNVNHRGWNPDLINFDSSRAYGIPSYHVQRMFSENRGDVVLPVDVNGPSYEEGPKGGAIGVGTWATQAEFKDIRVTHGDRDALRGRLRGAARAAGSCWAATGRSRTASSARPGSGRTSGRSPATRSGPITPSASRPGNSAARKGS